MYVPSKKVVGVVGLAILAGGGAAWSQTVSRQILFAEETPPTTLHPAYQHTMVEARLNELMFLGLFKDDRQLDPGPGLAESWKVSPDAKSMTVTLGDHVWHDGKPVTAKDVVFTIEALQNPESKAPGRRKVAFIESAKALSPKQVQIGFKAPTLDPARIMTFKILPAHHFKSSTLQVRHPFRLKPVGSGAFKFVRFEKNVVLTQNTTPGPRSLDVVGLQFIPSRETQLSMLQFNGVQGLVRVLPKHVGVVKSMKDTVRLHPYESLTWWYLGLNHRKKDVRIREVREAIAHSLDRGKIRQSHLGEGQTISGPFAPRSPYYNAKVKPRRYSQPKADGLMKQAGYTKKGGRYMKKGAGVAIDFVLPKKLDPYNDLVLDIQGSLNRAGFSVKVIWLDNETYDDRVVRNGKFDMTLGRWTFGEGSNIQPLFHSKGSLNYIGYSNPELDELLEKSGRSTNSDEFLQLYLAVHELAHQDLPYVFLWSARSYTAIAKEVGGVQVHPFAYFTWADSWKYRTPR